MSLLFIIKIQNSLDAIKKKKKSVADHVAAPSPKGGLQCKLRVRCNFLKNYILRYSSIFLWYPSAVSSRKYNAEVSGNHYKFTGVQVFYSKV